MEFKIAQSLRQLTNGTLQAAETVEGITRDSDVVYYDVGTVVSQDYEEIPALQELVTVEKTTKGIVRFKTYADGFTRSGLFLEEELAANKEIAVPTVEEVLKSIGTYRGQTTVSQEAIMDESDENIEAIVQKELQENSTVTRNRVITELFDEFATKTIKNITELKNAIITGVSGVHKPTLVINKSALAEITDLRYADGRFIFIQADQGDIDGYIFGLPVKSYDDTVLGGVGVPKALILGKNAIVLKDRGQNGAGWLINERFGKRLGVYDRFVAHVQYPKGGLNLNLQLEPEAPVVPGD